MSTAADSGDFAAAEDLRIKLDTVDSGYRSRRAKQQGVAGGDDDDQGDDNHASLSRSRLVHAELTEYLDQIRDDDADIVAVAMGARRRINDAILDENIRRKRTGGAYVDGKKMFAEKQLAPVEDFTEDLVVRIALARYEIRAINLAGGRGGADMTTPGVYNAKTGLYETDSEALKRVFVAIEPGLSQRGIEAAYKMVRTNAPQVIKTEDARYIAVNNGIFDHREQRLIDFTSDFVFLTKSPVDYHADAQSPVIIQPDGSSWDVDSWIEELAIDLGTGEVQEGIPTFSGRSPQLRCARV
ncbi:hypothetical protein [Nesterenkonia sp. NBAIMH1]|uniref:hypothetical protein n=1 Tax=Nesterenkonia sp. NBAIMH1 TaxID=2600320 RepID=UPI00143DC479|nr:hypothetical protein [Nesterenkonia sp. NBAIMH1]